MHSMTQDQQSVVVGGVDAHTDTHHFAALDQRGPLLATKSFAVSTPGYAEALDWLERLRRGRGDRGRVHGLLCRRAGALPARTRPPRRRGQSAARAHARRRAGKSDPLDAEDGRAPAAGRRGDRDPQADAPGSSSRSASCVSPARARSRPARPHLISCTSWSSPRPTSYASNSPPARRSRGKATLCLRLRPDRTRLHEPLQAAKLALRSHRRAHTRARPADRDSSTDTSPSSSPPPRHAPIGLLGVSTQHAGQLLVTAGQNIDRLRQRRRLRPPLRRQPDPRLLRQDDPTPAQPRRRPPSQPRTAPDRRLPAPLLPAHPRLRRTPHRRRHRPSARSSAASSATSPARSTTRSAPTSPTSTSNRSNHYRPPSSAAAPVSGSPANALDIYRNVRGHSTVPAAARGY